MAKYGSNSSFSNLNQSNPYDDKPVGSQITKANTTTNDKEYVKIKLFPVDMVVVEK